ncbi:arsenosugar biosynthesis radical SAM (seleno)protein ArsS [Prochlorococcus sp. MIT 0601]|uniref:arsenosugar biosynthesis radical SAM (seleno)protein ArsS n=1 Tax=Prochlorococcus marinus TaxID=1219 RepID=UPI0019D408D6
MNHTFPRVKKKALSILQVNLGYKCNQACKHCHVDASPNRKEMMEKKTVDLIPKVLEMYEIKTLDITGGAPEMHPYFKELIVKCRALNVEVIDRCNLTILKEYGYEYLSEFLANNKVKVIASLPCYEESNVDIQRGNGVFKKSIEGLKDLNKLGYGNNGSNLTLDLVYNPQGDKLPPDQKGLEAIYKKELWDRYKIRFNNLLVITNMPIKRFANQLKSEGKLDSYRELLIKNYNSKNLNSIMCLETISVDWKGDLYDCDFNQQLGINNIVGPTSIAELIRNKSLIEGQLIRVGEHCFGCTAGNGSSCGGSLS